MVSHVVPLGKSYEYIVANASICGIAVPYFAVKRIPRLIIAPQSLPYQLKIFALLIGIAPMLGLAITTSPRTAAIGILALAPISTIVMVALGIEPGLSAIVTAVAMTIAILYLVIR